MVADVVGEEAGVVVVAVGEASRQVLYHRQHEGTEDEPILIIIRTVGDEVDGEHDEGEEEPCNDDNLTDVDEISPLHSLIAFNTMYVDGVQVPVKGERSAA